MEQISYFDVGYDEGGENDEYDEEIEWMFNDYNQDVVNFNDEFASSLKTNPSNYKCLWEMYIFNKNYWTENFGNDAVECNRRIKKIVALYIYLYAKSLHEE
tara:strand:+ start:119 stop:421 length:303 start_codon:yes stop_codon:yes gene_type:complete